MEFIQSSSFMAALVTTGGGSGAIHALLSHPGASRFVLDAQIPYSPAALEAYLGLPPISACSEESARQLARAAYHRASRVTDYPLGISCTAALQTKRVRRGDDRAFIGIKSDRCEVTEKLDLKSVGRAAQEAELSAALLECIARFIGEESCKVD